MAQKTTIWIIIGVAVLLAVAGSFYFLKGSDYGDAIDSTASDSAAQGFIELPRDSEGNVIVKISGFAFEPVDVTVYPGQKIKWVNEDIATHQVYGDSKNAENIRSQEMKQGSYYIYEFKYSGTYSYHCTYHPSMKGKIIVK